MRKIIGTLISFILIGISIVYFFIVRDRVMSLYESFGAAGPSASQIDMVYVSFFLIGLAVLFFTFKKK